MFSLPRTQGGSRSIPAIDVPDWEPLPFPFSKNSIAKALTFDEARRIAVNVAKLAELVGAISKTEKASP